MEAEYYVILSKLQCLSHQAKEKKLELKEKRLSQKCSTDKDNVYLKSACIGGENPSPTKNSPTRRRKLRQRRRARRRNTLVCFVFFVDS